MKKNSFCIFLALILNLGVKSQINLIGIYSNSNTKVAEVAKWNAFDSNSLRSFPTNLLGLTANTGLFNPINSNYYLAGIADGRRGLFTFNALTNEENLNPDVPENAFSNSSEIDLSTGLIYNVATDSNRNLVISEFDPANLKSRTLGVIFDNQSPNSENRFDASGFDSNNGILYYAGHDGVTPCLYRIPVRNNEFTWSKVASPFLSDSSYTYSFLNYDNSNNILYATTKADDPSNIYYQYKTRIIEINTINGEVTARGTLPLLPLNPIGGVSVFDQESGNLLIIGYSSENPNNGEQALFIFNTKTNTYQRGYLPGFVSEIVCDNYKYVRKRFANTTSTTNLFTTQQSKVSIFPNPAKGKCTLFLSDFKETTTYQVINSQGQILMTDIIRNSNTEISTQKLPKGLYFLVLTNKKGKQTCQLVVE